MAVLLSSSDVALAVALKAGDLKVVERSSSYGLGQYWALEDAYGVVEVHLSEEEARARICAIWGAIQ